MTTEAKRSPAITWYRTPLKPEDMRALHKKSDLLGGLQTFSYLAVITFTAAASLYALHRDWVLATLAFLFLHGTVCAFYINGVHELGHGTVLKALNALFVRIFSFLGWINFEMFNVSHARHHRYTLHAPDDLEVVLPLCVLVRDFFLYNFINFKGPWHVLKSTVRIACGRFEGEWELALFPVGSSERKAPMRWAWTLLIGHLSIILFSIYFHLWLLPVVTTFSNYYGAWLFFLCNNTQHIGLQDDVPDFRLCCRTFTVNPLVQFLYWHMNYHTEHHMYAAVPCYRLGHLHHLIQYDLPPCPHGLIATWREIAAIQKIQESDPAYRYQAPLPSAASAIPALSYK